MGFFINNEIASVNPLNQITLAHNPHFIRFASLSQTEGTPFILKIRLTPPKDINATINILLTEPETGTKHEFKSTTNNGKINKNTFFIARDGIPINSDPNIYVSPLVAWAISTQNLGQCLMQDPYLKNNYDISTGFVTDHKGNIVGNHEICIKAKNIGAKHNLDVKIMLEKNLNNTPEEEAFTYSVQKGVLSKDKYNTIDYNSKKYRIQLDVYTNTGVFLGEDDSITTQNQGKILTSLVKSYHEKEIWFDLNTLLSKRTSYSDSFIDANSWCNAGTIQDYRLIGKRSNDINTELFYSSEVLYVINGYDYTLSSNSLNEYIFDVIAYNGSKIKPLSNSPVLNHIKGQKHYFNFILKNRAHSLNLTEYKIQEKQIGLLYKFYTQSGEYLLETVRHQKGQQTFSIINTTEITLDDAITEAQSKTSKTIGKVEVLLCCNGYEVSEAIVYQILPDNSYPIKDFAFLNRLGGWDCFNFGSNESVEFKTTAETYYQTLLPEYKSYSRIETVNRKSISETFSIKSQPVNKEIAEWLREMSASPAVYDLTNKRYVIISEMNLKYNSIDDLYLIDMKYRYSDNYNSGLNSGDSK